MQEFAPIWTENEPPIDRFIGSYFFLSNFYPCKIKWNEKVWPSSEHIYQAEKTLSDGWKELIRLANTPGNAKHMGKMVPLVSNWEEKKISVMKDILRAKFKDMYLGHALHETGDKILIEGNEWHDNFWGICSCEKCKNKNGQNMLGKLLMELREEKKEEWKNEIASREPRTLDDWVLYLKGEKSVTRGEMSSILSAVRQYVLMPPLRKNI